MVSTRSQTRRRAREEDEDEPANMTLHESHRGRIAQEQSISQQLRSAAPAVSSEREECKPSKRARKKQASESAKSSDFDRPNAGTLLEEGRTALSRATVQVIEALRSQAERLAEQSEKLQQAKEYLKQQHQKVLRQQRLTHKQEIQATMKAMQRQMEQAQLDANIAFQKQQAELVQVQLDAKRQLQELQAKLDSANEVKEQLASSYEQDLTALRKQLKAKDSELLMMKTTSKQKLQEAKRDWNMKEAAAESQHIQQQQQLKMTVDSMSMHVQQLSDQLRTAQSIEQQLVHALNNKQSQLEQAQKRADALAEQLAATCAGRDQLGAMLISAASEQKNVSTVVSSGQHITAASCESGSPAMDIDFNEVPTATTTTTACSSTCPAAASVSKPHIDVAAVSNNSWLCALPDQLITSLVMSLDTTSQLNLMGSCKAMSKYVMDINVLEVGKRLTCYISNDTHWEGLAQVLSYAPNNTTLCILPSYNKVLPDSAQGWCFPGVQNIIVQGKAAVPQLSALLRCCPIAHKLDVTIAVNDEDMGHIVPLHSITHLCVAGLNRLRIDLSQQPCSWQKLKIHSEILDFISLGCLPLNQLQQAFIWTSPTDLKVVRLPEQWHPYNIHAFKKAASNLAAAQHKMDIGEAHTLCYYLPRLDLDELSQWDVTHSAIAIVSAALSTPHKYCRKHAATIQGVAKGAVVQMQKQGVHEQGPMTESLAVSLAKLCHGNALSDHCFWKLVTEDVHPETGVSMGPIEITHGVGEHIHPPVPDWFGWPGDAMQQDNDHDADVHDIPAPWFGQPAPNWYGQQLQGGLQVDEADEEDVGGNEHDEDHAHHDYLPWVGQLAPQWQVQAPQPMQDDDDDEEEEEDNDAGNGFPDWFGQMP